jgi:hypothetical protein
MENTKREMEKSTSMATPTDKPPTIQVFVFQGEECLGWDCFCKERISIGSGQDVDMHLSDQSIADIHSVLSVEKGCIRVSFYRSDLENNTLHNHPETMILGPLDSLIIGPYTLKVKLSRNGNRLNEKVASLKDATAGHETIDPDPEQNRKDVQISCKLHQDHVPTYKIKEDAGTFQTREDVVGEIPKGDSKRYNMTFEGKIREDTSLEEVKKNLELLFKKDKSSTEKLFSGRKVILKRNADYQTVRELQSIFENTGALCSVEPSIDSDLSTHKQTVPASHEIDKTESQTQAREEKTQKKECESSGQPVERRPPVIDEDEDEDEAQATFSLKDKIRNCSTITTPGRSSGMNTEILLEVVKSRNDSIVDVEFLGARKKYFIQTEQGRVCLAENKGGGEILLYLDDQTPGEVKAVLTSGRESDRAYDRKIMFHRPKVAQNRKLSAHEVVVIHVGAYEYLLRQTIPGESPRVKETPKNDREYVRHFGRSVVFHVIILVILGMMPTYKSEPLSPEDGRFVQVDTKQLDEINKKIQPPQLPKKAPEIIKLKEQQVAQRIEKKPVRTTPAENKIVANQSPPTQSPSSGEGSSPGNVVNKNIHQAGILSMLGDNIGIKPQEAMAAVTNLDAVNSAAENKAHFKVGGIVGKLDGGKIEIPKSGIVNTKGSSQVLRGGGAGGSGGEVRVAALEKGNTGKNQVKAKVTAQLNKTVKVQGGGMSREEVKRIIDQHLDEITRCYETALVANPSLMGRVVFEWKILMSGKVGEVRIKSSTINSTEIHSCIQSAIKSWEFPQPEGSEVIVSYPFIFDIVGL